MYARLFGSIEVYMYFFFYGVISGGVAVSCNVMLQFVAVLFSVAAEFSFMHAHMHIRTRKYKQV